jgi:glycosyl hydrolase family 28
MAIGPRGSSIGDGCSTIVDGGAAATRGAACFRVRVLRAIRASMVTLMVAAALGGCRGMHDGVKQGPGPADAAAADSDAGVMPADAAMGPADLLPPPTCDVRSFGAKGDGTTKDTHAIQAAIDACAGTSGTVLLQGGTFLSGMVTLKSDLVFHVDATATLLGTQDDADYPSTNPPTNNTQLKNCRKTLVYAESAKNIRIEGGGTINGNGNTPKWIGPSSLHPEATRPMVIYTALCTNVTIQNLTIKDAAMWGVVNLEADTLAIKNLNIDTPLSGNRDGIDVVDCHHVTIDSSTIRSEDDSICIKSGSRFGVDDVTVKNCHIKQSIVANALKFGTASYGSFKNVIFQDIVVDQADKAAMAVEAVDGADIANITFQRITFHQVGTPIFILLGDRGTTPAGDVHKIGTIDGVSFQDVTGDNMKYNWSSPISGLAAGGAVYKIKHLTFHNVHITNKGGLGAVPADPPEYAGQYPDPNLWGNMPAFGYFIRHADGVAFSGCVTDVTPADARKAIEQRDVANLTIQ